MSWGSSGLAWADALSAPNTVTAYIDHVPDQDDGAADRLQNLYDLCLSWPRITAGPPAGRRSTASSITAHRFGGSARSSTAWRAIRSRTQRVP